MNKPPSGPFLRALLKATLTVIGLALLGAFLRFFALAFGYQPNDANLPVTLALAALVTVGLLWWKFSGPREEDDPDAQGSPFPCEDLREDLQGKDSERNQE